MNTTMTNIEKINAIVDDKLEHVLGQNRLLQYKSITNKHQRVEFLFNEVLKILCIDEVDSPKNSDLVNTINSAITLCVSRDQDAPVTHDVFQYILEILHQAKKLAKCDEDFTKVMVLLYEITGLT